MPATVQEAARGGATIRGAKLFQMKTHVDSRGELTALDMHSNLGFALQRVFYIRVELPTTIRGEHACSADQVIVALTGGVTIDVANGQEQRSVRLVQGGCALWLSAGVWLRLRDFLSGTVLSVAASAIYAHTRYFDRPQPDLVSAD
jgi:dTDP-4-dehydrorhamnose 3,5-epimerase-like enzyme